MALLFSSIGREKGPLHSINGKENEKFEGFLCDLPQRANFVYEQYSISVNDLSESFKHRVNEFSLKGSLRK